MPHTGHEGEAIIQATEVLARDFSDLSAARQLAGLLEQVQLRNPSAINPVGLAAAFGFIEIDHQVLVPTAQAYLKQNTALGDAIILGETRGWRAAAHWLLSSKGREVLRHPLWLAMLRTTANMDLEIEHLLSALRKELLMVPPKETMRKTHILNFALALVRQAEINEYVFAVSDQERQRLGQIFIKIDAVRDGSRAAVDNLLLKALYVPIYRLLEDSGMDLDCHAIRPKALAQLISTHMAERRVQAEMAQDISSPGVIDNDVSQNVARLYEQNPYPRWTSLHVPIPAHRRKHFLTYFSKQDLNFMDSPYKVLIAGSGTGQQAIDAALGYGPNAALIAIDLSLASLAYGKRMAGQFEADNVQFIQCDILNVDLLERQFDVIECIGVLHHMDDPWVGWKNLIDKLRPGGLMKIGLYSRAARRTIASLREDIKARGLSDDDDQAIRDYRQNIMTQGDNGKGAFLLQSADFFSLSNFRDLMFHVSEQHLTIPEIAAFMADNGLTFHGFQIPPDIAPQYPIGDDSHALEKWRIFENAHPDTFKGMYVFWCRKD